MKKSSEKYLTSNLLQETFKDIAKDLVGKIIRSKNDPVKVAIETDDFEDERILGMIVKVDTQFNEQNQECSWMVHVLVEESIVGLGYADIGRFLEDWELLKK